ncbi:MAG: VOC family protein, partial [Caulobacteraceae bacterium]
LGDWRLWLVVARLGAAPYPPASRSNDLWFQHFAVVTADMSGAMKRLAAAGPIDAIGTGGAQKLPPGDGGVTAFKFRDPDGHPLEFLSFPLGAAPERWARPAEGRLILGVDHSAIAVADTAASVRFYGQRLGLAVSERTLNRGSAQSRLDDLPDPVVEVTALSPAGRNGPHVELLCYSQPPGGRPAIGRIADGDIAASRLVFEADEGGGPMADPDGHRLLTTLRRG